MEKWELHMLLIEGGSKLLNFNVSKMKKFEYPSEACFEIERCLDFLTLANKMLGSSRSDEEARKKIRHHHEIIKFIMTNVIGIDNKKGIKDFIKTGIVSPRLLDSNEENLIILCLKHLSDNDFSSDFCYEKYIFDLLKWAEKIETFQIMCEREKVKDPKLASRILSMGKALSNDPQIFQFVERFEETKFIMVPSGDSFYIAIGGHDHLKIKEELEHKTEKSFQESLIGGGKVKIAPKENPNGILRVIFSDRSGTFGKYNKKVLLKFQNALTKYFRKKLTTDTIVVEINDSERE